MEETFAVAKNKNVYVMGSTVNVLNTIKRQNGCPIVKRPKLSLFNKLFSRNNYGNR